MSTYLNSGNGFKESGDPIPIESSKLLELTEKIVTIVSDGENAVIETAVESQKGLSDALSKLTYFANGGPDHILNPQKIEDLTKNG